MEEEQNGITNYGSWKEWGIYLVQQVKSMSKTQDKLEIKIDTLNNSIKKLEEKVDDMRIEWVEEVTRLKEKTNRQSTFYGVLGSAIAILIYYVVVKLFSGSV